jgi:prepilin-type N-terminal cleavage/methylation domain-containing protein
MSHRRNDRATAGFTLIEILVSLSIFLVVLATVAVALDSNRGTLARSERKLDAQQSARLALSALSRELRMAGWFPENFAVTPPSPPLAVPLRIAAHDALAIYGDSDGSGSSHVFLYCLDGNVLRRSRGDVTEPAAYWCPGGEILAEDVTELRFTYYDGEGVPLPDPPDAPFALDGQTTGGVPELDDVDERSAARRVVVALTVTEAVPGQAPQSYTLGTQVRLRNGS